MELYGSLILFHKYCYYYSYLMFLSLIIIVFLLSSIFAARYNSTLIKMELSDTGFLMIRKLFDVNSTVCNPYATTHFIHNPASGFANSFRTLRGIIALALMINASVTS